MKRFIIFKGSRYYPWGGAEDFFSSRARLPKTIHTEEFSSEDWCNALDTQTGKIYCWHTEKQCWELEILRQHGENT